jgi:uncharacterized surface protein with fasciclin (FAS1) repeats
MRISLDSLDGPAAPINRLRRAWFRSTAASTGQPSTIVVTPSGGDDDIGSREAKVVEADMEAGNGVIHAIDAVLVPEDLRSDLRDMKEEG